MANVKPAVERSEARLKFMSVSPKPVNASATELVKISLLDPNKGFPLVVQPALEGVDLLQWIKSARDTIEHWTREHLGVLFRGFEISSIEEFEQFARVFSPNLLDYVDQHTPRTKLNAHIYTSTEYPADHYVPFHSENSKNSTWPLKIWFFCLQPSREGGETPIADNRKVFQLIDPAIRKRFIEKNVMYVRNFGEGVGLTWQKVFRTSERAEVEAYCRQTGMQYEWKSSDRLRVRHVSQAVATHPQTHETVWFNQAHLFHVSGLSAEARKSIRQVFSEEELPGNAYYGDGSRIDDSVLDDIREAYWQSAVMFPWQSGDVLMLDNMLVAHSRTPYSGTRRVAVAMADSFSNIAQ
jgi:alpha-ketoglutarate-dependent taurine dioxygenase